MPGIHDLTNLLSNIAPELDARTFTFASEQTIPEPPLKTLVGQFQEEEGITLICESSEAKERDLYHHGEYKRITLTVHSSLDAVGLTAAVSQCLAESRIPCNLVAGFHHDHLFVPAALAESAMQTLRKLKPPSED